MAKTILPGLNEEINEVNIEDALGIIRISEELTFDVFKKKKNKWQNVLSNEISTVNEIQSKMDLDEYAIFTLNTIPGIK